MKQNKMLRYKAGIVISSCAAMAFQLMVPEVVGIEYPGGPVGNIQNSVEP